MYFIVILISSIYWIIYGNRIGGCLVASLLLVFFFSVRFAKKRAESAELLVEIKNRIVTEDEWMQIKCILKGLNFSDSRNCEVEYEIESALRKKKKKKTLHFKWGTMETDHVFLNRKCEECDFYRIRFLELRWKDLTGLYSVKKELNQTEEFLVMPKRFLLETMNEQIRKRKLMQQGFEYDGIRPYHPGDRMSGIHWKLFAGKNELYVRKSEDEEEETTALVLHLEGLRKKEYSDYFSAFYSISAFLMEEGISQEVYFGDSVKKVVSVEQYEELFRQIFHENLMKQPKVQREDAILIPAVKQGVSVSDYLYEMEL